MPLSDFGPFAAVFPPGELAVPGYLELLHLQRATAQLVFDRIDRALAAGDSKRWLDAMLADVDWRPHLVAAAALLLEDEPATDAEPLWRAIDGGSWVAPQLVVTALHVDPEFPDRLRSRVESLCPIEMPAGLAALGRHSATGPGGARLRSAKLLASLLTVGARAPALSEWIPAARAKPEVAGLLEEDVDEAGRIAEDWHARLVEQLARRGRELVPRGA